MLADLILVLRGVRRHPGFVATCSGILSLGLASSLVLFAAMDALLLRSLPYPAAEDLYTLRLIPTEGGVSTTDLVSSAELSALNVAGGEVSAAVGAALRDDLLFGVAGGSLDVQVAAVTAGFFEFFGTPLIMGKGFAPEEHVRPSPPRVVLSHRLWTAAFGANPNVLGSVARLDDGGLATIVGIASPKFELPHGADLWLNDRSMKTEKAKSFEAFLRARPDVFVRSLETTVGRAVIEVDPQNPRRVNLTPLPEALLGDVEPILILASCAAALLLLLSCTNVASLVIVRKTMAHRDSFIHRALGASSFRVVRQLCFEAAVLATAAACFGVPAALLFGRVLRSVASSTIPDLDGVIVDARVIAMALGVVGLTALIIAVPLAARLRWSGSDRSDYSERAMSPVDQSRLLRALSALGVAVAVVLVVCAGWLVSSFRELQRIEGGFAIADRLVVDVALPRAIYRGDKATQWFDDQSAVIHSLPEVTAVGYGSTAPFQRDRDFSRTITVVRQSGEVVGQFGVRQRLVSQSFFSAMNIPIKRGRVFTASDAVTAQPIAVVNDAFVRRFVGSEDPTTFGVAYLGVDLKQHPGGATIIGVVGDVRYASFGEAPQPTIYLSPSNAHRTRQMFIVGASEAGHGRLIPLIREKLTAAEPEAVISFTTMSDAVQSVFASRRLGMGLMVSFGLISLLLGAAGIFGLSALAATKQRREMAIRLALGAQRRTLVWTIGRNVSVPGFIGIGVGVVGAYLLAGLMQSTFALFRHGSPGSVATSLGIVVIVIILATVLPTYRATTVDVPRTLRD